MWSIILGLFRRRIFRVESCRSAGGNHSCPRRLDQDAVLGVRLPVSAETPSTNKLAQPTGALSTLSPVFLYLCHRLSSLSLLLSAANEKAAKVHPWHRGRAAPPRGAVAACGRGAVGPVRAERGCRGVRHQGREGDRAALLGNQQVRAPTFYAGVVAWSM